MHRHFITRNACGAPSPKDVKGDRRHQRRALTEPEIARLLAAARARPLEEAQARGLPLTGKEERLLRTLGEMRSMIYELRLSTGLRPSEAQRLRWCDVREEGEGRHSLLVHVPPGTRTKQSKSQHADVPLPEDLAKRLLALRPAEAAEVDPVFRLPGYSRGAAPTIKTFKADLKAAGIAYLDDEGRAADRYALRRTFNRRLVEAGTDPRVASRLMRHSSMDVTMESYTDAHLLDLHGAAERAADGGHGKKSAVSPAKSPPEAAELGVTAATGGASTDHEPGGGKDAKNAGSPAIRRWWAQRDSNPRPRACEARALTS